MLCAKFGWNFPSGSWEEDENMKSLQTDRQTDDGQQVIRKAHLSLQLGELKTFFSYTLQKSIIIRRSLFWIPKKGEIIGHNGIFTGLEEFHREPIKYEEKRSYMIFS